MSATLAAGRGAQESPFPAPPTTDPQRRMQFDTITLMMTGSITTATQRRVTARRVGAAAPDGAAVVVRRRHHLCRRHRPAHHRHVRRQRAPDRERRSAQRPGSAADLDRRAHVQPAAAAGSVDAAGRHHMAGRRSGGFDDADRAARQLPRLGRLAVRRRNRSVARPRRPHPGALAADRGPDDPRLRSSSAASSTS